MDAKRLPAPPSGHGRVNKSSDSMCFPWIHSAKEASAWGACKIPPSYTVPRRRSGLLRSFFPHPSLSRFSEDTSRKHTHVRETKRAYNELPKCPQTLLVLAPLQIKGCLRKSPRACEPHSHSSEKFCESVVPHQYQKPVFSTSQAVCLTFSLSMQRLMP